MPKNLMVVFWAFYALISQGVCIVPHPTNISVVCQNLVNVLYWNYSKPTEQLKFLVSVNSYLGKAQTFNISQTYLDISEYSKAVDDTYYVSVEAHDGQEESNKVFKTFTYNKDFDSDNTHKCSLDFPTITTSVHKDVINVSFLHPYNFYEEDSLIKDFKYKISHDQQGSKETCFEDEETCIAEIHLEQTLAGKCVELKFEGTIEVFFKTTYKNVCASEVLDDKPALNYMAAVIGGGVVILFIIVGFMWLLWKKWSRIPKIPEVLFSFMSSQKSTTAVHSATITPVSKVSPVGHVPLLEQQEYDSFDSPTISPFEKDTTIITTETEVVIVPETSAAFEGEVNFEESEDTCKSSDYDSPKFFQEMSPGDFATGYGPRPPVV